MKLIDKSVISFSPSRIERTTNAIVAMASVFFHATPILSMYKLSRLKSDEAGHGAIGILMGASLALSATMSLMASARRHVFGVSAAYCAVLMVFVGSTTQKSPCRL